MPIKKFYRYFFGKHRRAFTLRQQPKVYYVNVALEQLPEALDGFTICQLSDLHRGNMVTESYIHHAAKMAMALNPQLIVVTGDFVSTSAHYGASVAEALKELSAPCGVYGVLGNHDHWTKKVEDVAGPLEAVGVKMLTNKAVPLDTKGQRWWLAGVDDMWSAKPDIELALHGVAASEFIVLLSHCPDFADIAANHGVDLQLSGHSHGGQVAFWYFTHKVLPKKDPMGLKKVGDTPMFVYTNIGLGAVTMPLRIQRPPEITLLTLVKPETATVQA
jgi:predicted MPP superfamily phosphohydrolase